MNGCHFPHKAGIADAAELQMLNEKDKTRGTNDRTEVHRLVVLCLRVTELRPEL